MKCEAIFANRALYSVAKMCRAFQINQCVYYRWLRHKGLVFHSDRGCQYSSKKYKAMLEENGITGSMSSPGCPYDNSCMESFFASLKKELIYRRKYDTIEEVKTDIS